MSILIKTLGWVFVLVGLAAPAGVGYLLYARGQQVDTYVDCWEDFGSLPEEDQKKLLLLLDTAIDTRGDAKREAAMNDINNLISAPTSGKGGQ